MDDALESLPLSPTEQELPANAALGGYTIPAGATEEEAEAIRKDYSDRQFVCVDGKQPEDLSERHRTLCRHIAMGKRYVDISREMGISQAWISTLLNKRAIQLEIERYREKLYEQDLTEAMKDMGPKAIRTMQELFDSGEKLSTRVDGAKWLLEKLTGKAKQEHSVESKSLTDYMSLLKKIAESGQVQRTELPMIDVTPTGERSEPGEHRDLSRYDALIAEI